MNSYYVFAGGAPPTDVNSVDPDPSVEFDQVLSRLLEKARDNDLQRLENADCINIYATTFQSAYGNLLLVTNDLSSSDYAFITYRYVIMDGQDDPFQNQKEE